MNKATDNSDYLKDLQEYQETQYLPGYFLGGKQGIHTKYPTRRYGWFLLTVYVFPLLVFLITIAVVNGFSWPTIDAIKDNLGIELFVLLCATAGIKLVTRKERDSRKNP